MDKTESLSLFWSVDSFCVVMPDVEWCNNLTASSPWLSSCRLDTSTLQKRGAQCAFHEQYFSAHQVKVIEIMAILLLGDGSVNEIVVVDPCGLRNIWLQEHQLSKPKCLNSFHWLDLTVMVYKLDVGVNRSTYEQTKANQTQPQWTKKYWVRLERGKTSYLPVCSSLAFLWGTEKWSSGKTSALCCRRSNQCCHTTQFKLVTLRTPSPSHCGFCSWWYDWRPGTWASSHSGREHPTMCPFSSSSSWRLSLLTLAWLWLQELQGFLGICSHLLLHSARSKEDGKLLSPLAAWNFPYCRW